MREEELKLKREKLEMEKENESKLKEMEKNVSLMLSQCSKVWFKNLKNLENLMKINSFSCSLHLF